MLIYHFGSKNALLDEAMRVIAGGVTAQLDAVLGTHKRDADALMKDLKAATGSADFLPVTRSWFELVGLACRGEEAYLANALSISENWIEWINSRLECRNKQLARELYATIEGTLMIKVIEEARN